MDAKRACCDPHGAGPITKMGKVGRRAERRDVKENLKNFQRYHQWLLVTSLL